MLCEIWQEVSAYAYRRTPRDHGQAQEFVQEAAVDLMRRWRERGEVPRAIDTIVRATRYPRG